MEANEERSKSPDSGAGRAHGSRRGRTRTYRRSAALAVLVAAVAIGLAAFVSSGSAHPASSRKSPGDGHGNSTPKLSKQSAGNGSRSTTTTLPKDNASNLVDEWAACERSHGDASQADPTIDAHGVINITTPPLGSGATPAGDPHDVTGTCSGYLAAAQRALRAADPVPDPLGMDNQADLLKYVNCMRANGFPTYPYPSGTESDGHSSTNFNGTGIDPTSPAFLNGNANQMCGKQIGAPAWWINGWGPPGDVTVSTAGLPNNPPPCFFEKTGCGANRIPVPGSRISRRRPLPGWPRAADPAARS
jgi:hypothetical protein